MKAAREILVVQPLPEIHKILEAAHLPRRLTAPILTAYDAEPHQSAFGIVQAITLAAQTMTPETRVELEHAAGRYLLEQVP